MEVVVLVWHIVVVARRVSGPIIVIIVESLLLLLKRLSALEMDNVSTAISMALKNGVELGEEGDRRNGRMRKGWVSECVSGSERVAARRGNQQKKKHQNILQTCSRVLFVKGTTIHRGDVEYVTLPHNGSPGTWLKSIVKYNCVCG